jgi:hypothetical protein
VLAVGLALDLGGSSADGHLRGCRAGLGRVLRGVVLVAAVRELLALPRYGPAVPQGPEGVQAMQAVRAQRAAVAGGQVGVEPGAQDVQKGQGMTLRTDLQWHQGWMAGEEDLLDWLMRVHPTMYA